MTTNVIDLVNGEFACDSRWSCDGPGFVLYADDTGFEKIAVNGEIAMIFAGHGGLIQAWKDWLKSQPDSTKPRPPTTVPVGGMSIGISLCVVNTATCKVLFQKDQLDSVHGALFAGSGKVPALLCWARNQNAQEAVQAAINVDIKSGGTVRYLVFDTRESNVVDTTRIDEVDQILAKEGMVVYVNQSGPVTIPVGTAEKSDSNVRDLVKKIKAGDVAATAPCDSMYLSWSQEDLDRLDTALLEAFGAANEK